MNPSPISLALVISITLAAGCKTVQDDGLNRFDPSVQPAGSGARADAATSPPATPTGMADPPDAARPVDETSDDAGTSEDAAVTSEDAAVTSEDAGTSPPADAAITPSPDVALPPEDAAPALPPDAATPPDPGEEPAGSCPQNPDLALCLRFEGEVRDESRYHLTAAITNVAFQGGPAGQAIDLGAQSSVVVPPNPLFDSAAVTLEAWVRPRALGRRTGVIFNGNQYALVILPSGSAMCTGGGGYALTPNAVSAGQWTSLACTYDADRVALWIDGRMTAESPRMGPLRTGSLTGVGIGYEVPEGNAFDGLMDNVRVWLRVRSPGQICAAARNCTRGQGP